MKFWPFRRTADLATEVASPADLTSLYDASSPIPRGESMDYVGRHRASELPEIFGDSPFERLVRL